LKPHALPQGSLKLVHELWVLIRHNVLWEAMMFKHVCENNLPVS
jgi:hypothetical protein